MDQPGEASEACHVAHLGKQNHSVAAAAPSQPTRMLSLHPTLASETRSGGSTAGKRRVRQPGGLGLVGREVDVRRPWGWCSGPYGYIMSKAAASAPIGTDHGLSTVHPIMGKGFDEACGPGLEACGLLLRKEPA